MLNRKQKYLQIAFNRTLEEVAEMVGALPMSNRIIIEAGYPLIKTYGVSAISDIKNFWEQRIFRHISGTSGISTSKTFKTQRRKLSFLELLSQSAEKEKFQKNRKGAEKNQEIVFAPYIVADLKCMDRAFTEVEAAATAGASAVTCMGLAPIETINMFIKRCEEAHIDSALDMMNIKYPFEVLGKLAKSPTIVMLHRGVDEGEKNKEKEIPYHEIERIKSVYDDILIAVAGGETIREVVTGVFNGADIIIVWKLFNKNPTKVAELTSEFLEEIK